MQRMESFVFLCRIVTFYAIGHLIARFQLRLENLENENGHGKVMEHEKLANFAPKFYPMCMFFVTAKKINSNLESLHFPMFSAKCHKYKIGKRDGHGKSRNGHGKVMEK